MMKKFFLRRVDGSKKMKTNLRICLPEKCNVSLIIGREKKFKKAKGDRKEDTFAATLSASLGIVPQLTAEELQAEGQ